MVIGGQGGGLATGIGEDGASDGSATVRFTNSGSRAIVILNDRVLGVTEAGEVTITGIDTGVQNVVSLVPLDGEVRGEAVTVEITAGGYGQSSDKIGDSSSYGVNQAGLIESRNLRAPATGRR